MELREERAAGVVVLTPVGRVDSTSSGELERRLLGLLGGGDRRLVVDLAGVDYVSSAGLRVLLMLAKRLRETQGQLVLCAMAESVRQVFELAGFVPLFAIEPSRERALARLAGTP